MDKLILTLKRLRDGISFASVIVTVVLFFICREQAVSWRGNETVGGECMLLFIPLITDIMYINIRDIILEHYRMNAPILKRKVPKPTIKIDKILSVKERILHND